MFSPALRRRSYRIFAWMLETLPCALPLKRLRETEHLLAFRHPRPDDPFLSGLVTAVQSLVSEYRLPV